MPGRATGVHPRLKAALSFSRDLGLASEAGAPGKAIEQTGESPVQSHRYGSEAEGNCVFNRKGGAAILGPSICFGLPQAISAKELASKESRIFTVGGCRICRTVQFIEAQPSHQSVFAGCRPRSRTISISSCSLPGPRSRSAFVESQAPTCRRVATL